MSDKKQSETEQPRQQNKVWPWVKGIIWIIMIALGGLSLFICWFYLSPERRAANDHTALILYLIGLAAIGVVVLYIPQIITANPKNTLLPEFLSLVLQVGHLLFFYPQLSKALQQVLAGYDTLFYQQPVVFSRSLPWARLAVKTISTSARTSRKKEKRQGLPATSQGRTPRTVHQGGRTAGR